MVYRNEKMFTRYISTGSVSESESCKSTKQVVNKENVLEAFISLHHRDSQIELKYILYCNPPPVSFCAVAFV